MDNTAIKQIQQQAVIEALNADIAGADTATPVVAVPDNFALHDLEKFMPGRARFRGEYETRSIEDFLAYSLEYDNLGAGCFVDPERMRAKAIFNLGIENDPGHADHTATLTMKETAEYRALLDVHCKTLDQKELAEFVEDWSDYIDALDSDGNQMSLPRAVTAIRNMSIEAKSNTETGVGDFKASRSSLESVEAKSKHDMPNSLRVSCVPYEGLAEREFELRLSAIAHSDNGVKFSVRIKRHEALVQDIGNELAAAIQSRQTMEMSVFIGTFKA